MECPSILHPAECFRSSGALCAQCMRFIEEAMVREDFDLVRLEV